MSGDAQTPGTVPAAVPPFKLKPDEVRALREQARREVLAEEKDRIAKDRAAKGKAPAPAAKAEPPAGAPSTPAELDPARTDAHRAADAAMFLRGVLWPVVGGVAWLVGWDVDPYTAAMAAEDSTAWVPLARRYRVVDLVITWAGVPARLMARIKELAHRRPASQAEQPPGVH
jgi:hypothetical protein